jgi:phosphoribosylformimino-5-aminoimidazole carboxamide ribotide isomerase
MIVYPTIELQSGRCVSLYRGRLDEPQIWHVDPVQMARGFAHAGASWIHVTDFDGVAGGSGNTQILKDIIRMAEAPIQLGGGFRSLETIAEWIDLGAGRIVVSTLAVTNPQLVKEAARHFPDQIVLAVDVFEGRVMSDGWRNPSTFEPDAFIRTFERDPLAAIIVTDIGADLGDTEEPLALITRLASVARAPVIARGLSRSLDDLARIKYVPGISGAILGRALFDKSIAIEDAMKLAHDIPEKTAAFI